MLKAIVTYCGISPTRPLNTLLLNVLLYVQRVFSSVWGFYNSIYFNIITKAYLLQNYPVINFNGIMCNYFLIMFSNYSVFECFWIIFPLYNILYMLPIYSDSLRLLQQKHLFSFFQVHLGINFYELESWVFLQYGKIQRQMGHNHHWVQPEMSQYQKQIHFLDVVFLLVLLVCNLIG